MWRRRRITVFVSLLITVISISILLVSVNNSQRPLNRRSAGNLTGQFLLPGKLRGAHDSLGVAETKQVARDDYNMQKLGKLGRHENHAEASEKSFNLTALQQNLYLHVHRLFRNLTYREVNYFNLSRVRTDHCDFEFLIDGSNICKIHAPFLVVLIPSSPDNIEERLAIRDTWGQFATGLKTPLPDNSIVLGFLLGKDINASNDNALKFEFEVFQDLIVGNFQDTYKNLTRKMLMGLKWVSTFCAKAEYILKADDDVYVHIPRLVDMLKRIPASQRGGIYGKLYHRSPVQLSGKHAVSHDDYPLSVFPPYMSGNTYVISGEIVGKLLKASQYMPYLYLEDVFITGIIRLIIGAYAVPRSEFTWIGAKQPDPCVFMRGNDISGNIKNLSLVKTLWFTQQNFSRSCDS